MLTFYPLPGTLDMRLHIVKATELYKVQEQKFDEAGSLILIKKSYKETINEVLVGNTKTAHL